MAERRLFNLILSCYLMEAEMDGGWSVVAVLVNNKDRSLLPYNPVKK